MADETAALGPLAEKVGVSLDEGQLDQFRVYLRTLLDWNTRTNLTAITEPREVVALLFADSLAVAQALPPAVRRGGSLLDVGTGAGFPGIPLRIAFPRLRVTLLEATGKKVAFLTGLLAQLGMPDVAVAGDRAETAAHRPDLRAAFDVVTARAVAALPELLELTLPFCKLGGLVVAQKASAATKEVLQSARALNVLGGRVREVRPVPEECGPGRVLVVVEKVKATSSAYPRRPGIPHKSPL